MKDLKIYLAFSKEGKQLESNNKKVFSNIGHIKTSYNWSNVQTIYEYNIDTENLTVTRRTWVKDIHGQLHEATGIKPVV